MRSRRSLGVLLAIIGSLCWGIQGPVSQFLFHSARYSPEWLMGVKMSVAGILILWFAGCVRHRPVFRLWRSRRSLWIFLAYAVFGLAAVQYLYLVTVKFSNAGTATVLQNLGTVLIVIFTVLIYHRLPTRCETVAILAALVGTWLLITRGEMTRLSMNRMALTCGLLLAFAGALQTMLPVPLLKKFSTLTVVGWAMVVGGLLFTAVHPFWINPPRFTVGTVLGVAFIVFFGTMLSFVCFISSLHFISPTVAGMLDTFEPLSATTGAVVFLGTAFNGPEICGGVLILSTVFILALDHPQC